MVFEINIFSQNIYKLLKQIINKNIYINIVALRFFMGHKLELWFYIYCKLRFWFRSLQMRKKTSNIPEILKQIQT